MDEQIAAMLDKRFEELMERMGENMSASDEARLRAAFSFAVRAHEGQLRKDGSPYVTHPLEVAHIVADLTPDP